MDLTDDEIRVARLLASGLTIRAVARRTGVNDRTISRRISALTWKTGARSPVQLGMLLERAGALECVPGASVGPPEEMSLAEQVAFAHRSR